MKVFKGLDDIQIKNPVVSIGTFDGVHFGHKIILERLIEEAKRLDGESVLITFWPHPRMVLQPDYKGLRLLNTLTEKQQRLEEIGLDNLIIIPFTQAFSRISSHEFIRDILVNTIAMRKIIIGYDHHFGRNREGSFEILEEYAPVFKFEVEEILAQQIDEINISSTKIRAALDEGEVATAANYLGYEYFISGTVVKGHSLGKTIGFPTANIKVNYPFKLIPADGVYAVKVKALSQDLFGMMNIGFRPTFEGQERSIEVHLFDFDGNLYAEDVKVQLVKRLRPEQKFESKEALIEQLKQDEIKARRLLGLS